MKTVQFALLSALLLGMATTAQAQNFRSPRYVAPRPSISPWLDLERQDNGGPLDNYNALVRPKQRTIDKLGRQGFAIRQQRQAIYGLGSQLQQRPAGIRPTGTHSSFMNYSHFFPAMGRR